MRKMIAAVCFLSMALTPKAFAGSDTVSCATALKSISFSVGNGDHMISIMMKDKKTGKTSEYKTTVKLMVVYDKNGKFKCSGREITDETYKQTMLLTQRVANRDDQGFDYQIIEGKSVAGLDSSTGYITAEFICRHEQVTSAGGCSPDEGDSARIEKRK